VLPRLKEAMLNLSKNKEIVPLFEFELVAYRIQISNMIVAVIDFFSIKQFVNICVNLSHLCLSNFDKTAITVSEQVVQLAAVMRG
jgi:hypothetical protein